MTNMIKILLIALSLSSVNLMASREPVMVKSERNALAKEVSRYYWKSDFAKRQSWEFRPFLLSASKVAAYFPMFPAESKQAAMLEMFCYGASETRHTLNLAHLNVPGVEYNLEGKKVIRYSVDVGWDGLSENNVEWTYELARIIQQKKPIPKYIGTKKFRDGLRGAYIPKNLKLKKIDLTEIKASKKTYNNLAKIGMDPNKIRKTIKVTFEEKTQDDIDSMLIYRVLVELDRYYRGWEFDSWDKKMYDHLSPYVE